MRIEKNKFRVLGLCIVILLGVSLGAQLLLGAGHAATPTSPASFSHIVIIAMENQNYGSVIGSSSAPFINSLAALGTTISSYHSYGQGIGGCSAGCYTAITSGGTWGVSDGVGSGSVNQPNIFSQVSGAGLTWKAFCENNCPRSGDHFPPLQYANTYGTTCASASSENCYLFTCPSCSSSTTSDAQLVAELNSTAPANFIWFTPTDAHNMHDVSVSTGDSYLKQILVGSGTIAGPASGSILASSLFKQPGTFLYLWWDEYDPSPNVEYGSMIKVGYTSSVGVTEYDSLHTFEANWGLPYLTSVVSGDGGMVDIFTSGGPIPLSASFTSVPSSPLQGSIVTFSGLAAGGTPPYTCSWTFGDGSTGTGQTATHTYASSGSFSATLTVKDSASPQNSATSSNTIIVSPPPSPDFGISSSTGSINIQQGNSGTTTITLTSISGLIGTVSLSTTATPQGPTIALTSSSVTLTSGGTGTSTLTVNTTNTTPRGTYSVVVAGTSGTLSHSVTISVTVTSQPPPPGKAPTLVGWGGVRLEEATAGSAGLSKTSSVYPNESISSLEAHIQLFQSLGYNTIRVSFENQCGSPMPQLGPYSATNLARAIMIAKYYHFWILVDWHGYHDLEPTYLTCWLSTWKGIVQQFSGSYSQIVWEPENEPIGGSNSSGGSITLSQLSSGYQQWINQARSLGDTHYIVVPNLCVYTCNGWPTAAATSWPTVNDTVGHIFINMHTYMYYPYWSGQGWNNATADNAANAWIQAIVQGIQTTGWPALITEGGADWISGSPPDVVVPGPGSVSATVTTIHFVQELVYLADHNSPRIGWVLWPTGLWTNCCTGGGLYGALQPGGWGNDISPLPLVTTPDFGITASPPTLSIIQGSSGSATITVSSLNGYAGAVSLTAAIAPAGPTLSCNPSSLTLVAGGSATSAMTVTTTRNTSVASFIVTITASNGTNSHIQSLLVSVTAPPIPDFGMSANPTNLSTILQGASGTSTITITSVNSLSGSITLSTSQVPSGATAIFNPSTVVLSAGGTGTSTLTVATTSTTPVGTYTVSLMASNGTITHSVTISFSVATPPTPDFAIASDQSSLSIVVGSSGTVTITLSSLAGFTGPLSLSSSISGSTATSSFNPSTISLSSGGTGSSALTISTTPSSATGPFNLLVTASSGSLSHSLTISVTVRPAPDFSLVASPSSISIPAGSSGYVTLAMISLNGFAGTLTLSASIPGAGFSSSTSPSSLSVSAGGQSTSALTISTTNSASARTYGLVVTATGTGVSHQVTIQVTITAPSIQPLTGSFTTSETSSQVGQTISFTASATNGVQPYKFMWNFGDGAAAIGSSSSHAYGVPGNYTVTLIVIDASNVTVAVQKIVSINSNLPLITGPGSETASTGSLLTFTITASNPGIQGPISLSATNLPPGATFTSTPGNPATGTFTWTPNQSEKAGTYTVTFKAVQAGSSYTTSKTVIIGVSATPSNPCFFICGLSPLVWSVISLVAIGGTVGLLAASSFISFRATRRIRPNELTATSVPLRNSASMPSRVGVTSFYGVKREPFGSRSPILPQVHRPGHRKLVQEKIDSAPSRVRTPNSNGRRRRNPR